MLAFLGWNPGTSKELYHMEELIHDFSLERLEKAGRNLILKTKWYNQQHLRSKSNEILVKEIKDTINYNACDSYLEGVIELMKERATFTNELLEKYFFESPDDYDEKTFRKKWKENSSSIIEKLLKR